MKKVIVLNKKEGETPLESLEKFRKKNKEYKDSSMTYAGRLDPMASGVLLVLARDEIKKKEKYLNFKKEYEFEILFGFTTDTYDILGKVVKNTQGFPVYKKSDLKKLIKDNLKYFTGKFKQKYPLYSSKTVKGKQLFQYARSGEVVLAPEREVRVDSLKFNKIKTINKNKLLENIEKRINKVKGDFRQKEILKIWRKKLSQGPSLRKKEEKLYIASFKIKCGSGTYVRGIADSLGKRINIPALAFSIKRTKVGRFEIKGKNN